MLLSAAERNSFPWATLAASAAGLPDRFRPQPPAGLCGHPDSTIASHMTGVPETRSTPDGASTATVPPRTRFAGALAVYLNPRVLIVLFLGFSAGLPLALSGSTL